MQENLKKKYGVTDAELKHVRDQIRFGKITGNGKAVIALCDLLTSGDIATSADEAPTIRDFLRANFDNIIDEFVKDAYCEICPREDECAKIIKETKEGTPLFPCDVNKSDAAKETLYFLNTPATAENIDILDRMLDSEGLFRKLFAGWKR